MSSVQGVGIICDGMQCCCACSVFIRGMYGVHMKHLYSTCTVCVCLVYIYIVHL